MIGIELFSGARGMSLGASLAGANTKMAVEIDKFVASTFEENHPDSIFIAQDIRKVDEFKFMGTLNEQQQQVGNAVLSGTINIPTNT